jgi:superfamily II DNA or RNA helicase
MEHSILSINGYGIPKKNNIELITKLKDELTMTPNANFTLSNPTSSFAIYTESEKRLYVPRFYGLQKFGQPYKCTLSQGEHRDNMVFVGTLREQQLEPVNNFVKAAIDPCRHGGIISVPCGFGKTIMSVYIACHFKKNPMFVSHKDFLNHQFI